MNINVLVIEDEHADVVVIREALAISGRQSCHIECASSLAEGLKRLQAGGIDIVLLDLSLPDCEGSGSVHRLQSLDPGLAILVVSGAHATDGERGTDQWATPRFILRDRVDCHRLGDMARSAVLAAR